MAFIIGVVLFALGIAITIALHEWGHLTAARLCGMRVRRYFVGFGPTLWSMKRKHASAGGHITEYGVKAVPFGGFCDIAGMTAQDPIQPEEEPYAMWKSPWWQRIIVLSGGVAMNLVVGVLLIYVIAVSWGLPNLNVDLSPRVAQTQCVAPSQNPDGTLTACSGTGPAARDGVEVGDVIVAVDGKKTKTYPEVVSAIGASASEAVRVTVNRNGGLKELTITPERVERLNQAGEKITQRAIGISFERPKNTWQEFTPLTAVPGSLVFTGQMFSAVWDGLLSIPGKVPGVVASIFGADRDPESPMSVVGASRAGGELVQANQWSSFMLLLANLNFFLALFNLVPLPPLDGGHIVVVIYERLRDGVRKLFGLAPKGPADYRRLMPVSMAFTAVLLVFGVVVIAADVVNPIRLFG